MASCLQLSEKQIEDCIRCPVCFEQYENPKIFPCVHTICLNCVKKLVKDSSQEDVIVCPICREKVHIPTEGPAKLKNNIYVQNLLDMIASKQTQNAICTFCNEETKEEVQGVYKCLDCEDFLCLDCQKHHSRTRTTRNHVVVSLVDLQEGKYDEYIRRSQELVPCEQHDGEKMKLFCETCDVLMCHLCALLFHKDHRFCDLLSAAKLKQKEIDNAMELIGTQLAIYKDTKTEVLDKLSEIEQSKTQLLEFVDKAGQDLVSYIQNEVRKTEESITSLTRGPQEHLSQVKSELEVAEERLQESASLIEKMTKDANIEELMCLHNAVAETSRKCQGSKSPIDVPDLQKPFSQVRGTWKELGEQIRNSSKTNLTSERDPATTELVSKEIPSEKRESESTDSYCPINEKQSVHIMANLTLIKQFEAEGHDPWLTSCAWTSKGEVVVVDKRNDCLDVYANDGTLRTTKPVDCCDYAVAVDGHTAIFSGARGFSLLEDVYSPNESRDFPISTSPAYPISTYKDRQFAVFNRDSSEIAVVDKRGVIKDTIIPQKRFGRSKLKATFMAVTSGGDFVISTAGNSGNTRVLSPNGDLKYALDKPWCKGDICIDRFDNIFFLHSSTLVQVDKDGSKLVSISVEPFVDFPRGISYMSGGGDKIAVVGKNGEIAILRIEYENKK